VWDFEVPGFHNYVLAGVVHHNSGKSEWAAKRTVQMLTKYKPGDTGKPPIVWIFSTTEETSKRDLQTLVWKYLPREWKGKRVKTIVYNTRTRFADNYFVCPNGAECWFKNYRQDPMTIEGGQVDIAWCDEDVPVEWLTTLRSRLVDRAGKLIVTFTPINGWNATVAEYLVGCKVEDWCDCDMYPNDRNWPGGPAGKVPYIAQPVNQDHGVIWFQPRWNPFIDYNDLKSAWKHKDRGQVLIRLYGAVQKAGGTKFPKFGKHNIVKASQIPERGTDYHLTDFAWARPWAMIWVRVVRIKDRKWIYVVKDWPNQSTYGEWVVPSGKKKDGAPGPAQNPIGYGIESYAQLINDTEKEHKLRVSKEVGRFGDPRSGKAPAVTEEDGGTDLMALMAEHEIYIQPAKGVAENEGINIINDWLDYDEGKPIDSMNQPMLYVSEDCQQVIDCLKTWTGGDGKTGASKDFIDLLRYAAVQDLDEMTPEMFQSYGGFTY
jgi:phage terminase large subunit-like protein